MPWDAPVMTATRVVVFISVPFGWSAAVVNVIAAAQPSPPAGRDSSLVRGNAYYASAGGAAPVAVLRDRRRGVELRPCRRTAAHRGPVTVPADQGART